MEPEQKSAIKANLEDLCTGIDVHEIITLLRLKNILNEDCEQRINKEPVDRIKAIRLFDTLVKKDGAWEPLLDVLKEAQHSGLAKKLKKSLDNEYAKNATTSSFKTDNPELSSTIAHSKLKMLQNNLRQYIKEDCEKFRPGLNDYLRETKLEVAFEDLRLIETNGGRTCEKNIDCGDYSYLTDQSTRIFLIEGEPGIGKSTYVNKIALDWAKGNKILSETFDIVVTITWQQLEQTNWQESIVAAFGSDIYADCLKILLKSNKFLIILDGYDENPMEKVLQEITAKKDPITGDRMSARLLITTRGSHVEDFKEFKNKMWLQILGFDETSALKLITTQLNNPSAAKQIITAHEDLIELVKNPLYASMIAATALTEELIKMEPQMRLKLIFASFSELHKKWYFETCSDSDKTEYNGMIEQLTKYALKFLGTSCQNELEKALGIDCKSMIIDAEKVKNQWLKLGLVHCFKKERINECIEKISFRHQTFAEYHAAIYVAKHAIRLERSFGELLRQSPQLFTSFVLAMNKDLFVAALECDYPGYYNGIPFVPLPLKEIEQLWKSCKISKLYLHQWIIDEASMKMITDVPTEEIQLKECDINLINLNLNEFFQKNDKVTSLKFYRCKLAVANYGALFKFVYRKLPKLKKLSLMDNLDKRYNNGSSRIEIYLKSDCDTLKGLNASGGSIDCLRDIFRSHKTIQNYYAVNMVVENVQNDNYNEIFGNYQTKSEYEIECNGLISYLDHRFRFAPQDSFKRLKWLTLENCYITVDDIIAIFAFKNLSNLVLVRSKFSKNFSSNQTNKQIFTAAQVTICDSEEIYEYLTKNFPTVKNILNMTMLSNLFTVRPGCFNLNTKKVFDIIDL